MKERVRQVIETNANIRNGSYATIAAKLYLKQDAEWCSGRLMELLEDPSGDMFWMFPVTAVAFLDRGQLTCLSQFAEFSTGKPFRISRGV